MNKLKDAHIKKIDKASGIIFFLGILSAKLCYLPVALVSGVAYILSLVFYLVAYVLWLIATHFYPNHPPLRDRWFGFSAFRDQNKASATIGALAVIFSFVAFAVPIIIIPSLWLFVISNLIWSISHYHKLKNPILQEDFFSRESQGSFLSYTILTTTLSLVTAVCLTAAFLCPPVAAVLLTVSTAVGIALTVVAMGYFAHYHLYGYYKQWKGQGYAGIMTNLSPTARPPEPVDRAEPEVKMAQDMPYAPLLGGVPQAKNSPDDKLVDNLVQSVYTP